MINYAGILFILIFLLVTFLMSAYEKMFSWKDSCSYYCELYKDTFKPIIVKIFIVAILGFEIITSTIIVLALIDIFNDFNFLYAQYSLIFSCGLLIILLIGLRTVKDYAGASRIGIYFLISVLGLIWLPYINLIAL